MAIKNGIKRFGRLGDVRKAVKTTVEVVNNSDVLQNDDELFLSVLANRVYLLIVLLYTEGGSTPAMKIHFTGPAGATLIWDAMHDMSLAGGGVNTLGGTLTKAQNGEDGVACIGILTTAGDAGTLQLQWAQNTANVSDTKVHAGSMLLAIEMG